MSQTNSHDLAALETAINDALDRRAGSGAAGQTADGPAEAVVRAELRWAVWCIESLRELRVLVDLTDARGLNETPQGYRTQATSMGHIMWAATTAMGALDRAAAGFGAIHFGVREDGRVHDLGELIRRRGNLPRQHAVGDWLDAVQRDPAYSDLWAFSDIHWSIEQHPWLCSLVRVGNRSTGEIGQLTKTLPPSTFRIATSGST